MQINGTNIPALSDFEEYRALTHKRAELMARQKVVEAELNAIREAISARTYRPLQPSDRRVAAILGDDLGPNPVDREQLSALSQEADDLRRALDEISRRIIAARQVVSRQICAGVAPEHARLVRNICLALIEAHKANVAYRALADQLNARDVMWCGDLFPMHPGMLGDARDSHSRLAFYLREAVEHGMFDAADIPPELSLNPPVPQPTLQQKRRRITALMTAIAPSADTKAQQAAE